MVTRTDLRSSLYPEDRLQRHRSATGIQVLHLGEVGPLWAVVLVEAVGGNGDRLLVCLVDTHPAARPVSGRNRRQSTSNADWAWSR
jgi:hypothetical protein